MMKIFSISLLALGFVSNSFATRQVGEWLFYKGTMNQLRTLPLEPYLKAHNLRLHNFTQPGKIMISTACWRGYIGTWQIKDGFLWLVGVEDLNHDPVPLFQVFTNQLGPIKEVPPIKATWFSGTLQITQGKMIHYVHADFESKFEREIYIVIENGTVRSEKVIENKTP